MNALENGIIRYKPLETLQAQAEVFLATRRYDSVQSESLLTQSQQLAGNMNLSLLPSNAKKLVPQLRQFLHHAPHEEIAAQIESIRTYNSQFSVIVTPMIEQLKQRREPQIMRNYYDKGDEGYIYKVDVDNNTYAVKIFHTPSMRNRLRALLRAKGISHAPQVVAHSYQDQVIVMNFLPGKNLINSTVENPITFSDEHIIELIETTRSLFYRGIRLDYINPANYLYDDEKGFFVLDFGIPTTLNNLPSKILSLAEFLSFRNRGEIDLKDMNEIRKRGIQIQTDELPVTIYLVDLVKTYFPDIYQKMRALLKRGDNRFAADVTEKWHTEIPEIENLQQLLIKKIMG